MRAAFLFTAAILLVAPPTVQAQSDDAQIRAVITEMFDAMRTGDGAKMGRLFLPEATLKSVGLREGATVVRQDSVAAFVRAVGTPRTQVWDERISNVMVMVDGPYAVAWMDYAFYVDTTFSHCGVNAFEMVRTAEGWRVLGITDTRRRTDCSAVR